ncbi:MAG: hypothetical protein AB7U92_19405, partial [Piscinibacter sp.]|uniref:hypothetical protein n=1 Tax=Piscinibacter sp. TaxID=1903157 RepID=UPI003D0F99C7
TSRMSGAPGSSRSASTPSACRIGQDAGEKLVLPARMAGDISLDLAPWLGPQAWRARAAAG